MGVPPAHAGIGTKTQPLGGVMNTDRILDLADHIDELKHVNKRAVHNNSSFSLRGIAYECGSPSNIAGHAVMLALHDKDFDVRDALAAHGLVAEVAGEGGYLSNPAAFFVAQDWLGIDYQVARRFFEPWNLTVPLDDIAPEQAAAMLRQYVESSHITWSIPHRPGLLRMPT